MVQWVTISRMELRCSERKVAERDAASRTGAPKIRLWFNKL